MQTNKTYDKNVTDDRRAVRRAPGVGFCVVVGFVVSSCYIDELTAPPADETSIEFSVSGDSVVLLGDSLQLSAAYDGGVGTGATRITWVSEDTTVVRLDATSGTVYGVGVGTTQVAAYLVAPDLDNDLLRTWPMEVQYAGIGMSNDSMTGYGETRTLEARGTDVQGGMHEVVPAVFWSPDDSIIRLDSSGTAIALLNGTAMVNASWGGFTTQAPIKVRQVAGRITFAVPELKFPVLQVDTTIAVEVRDTQDSLIVNPALTWSSSNSSVISASSTGVLRALQRGSTTITATSDTVTTTLPVGVAQVVASLTIFDGSDQTAQVDTTVAITPSVIARDATGNPVEGALVRFFVEGGGGAVVDPVQLTDAQGIAKVGAWFMGQVAGPNILRASADSVSTAFTAVALPGTISALQSLVTSTTDTILAGLSANLILQGRDEFGNAVTTGGSTVVFSVTGGSSTGSIGATTDNGDGTYTASFTGALAGTAATIGATIDGIAVSTTQPSIIVLPGAAAVLTRILGEGQTAGVGLPVFVSPSVRVTDAFTNPVPNVSIDFTVTAGGGSVAGTPAVSGADGVATVGSWTLGATPGLNTLSASSSNLSPVVFAATGLTNAASTVTSLVTVSVDTILAGATSVLTLQTKDAGGNDLTVGGFTVVFTSVGGTSTGTISTTTDNGDGTYTATFSGELAGTGVTIAATINGSPVTTTLPTIAVLPGAVSTATSLVTSSLSTLVAGTNTLLTLTTKDAFGNDVTSGGRTVAFNLSGGTSTGVVGPVTDNGDGTYTANLTGQLAGTPVTIGATIDGAAVTGALPSVSVIPGAVSTLTSLVTSSLSSVAAGSNAVLTLVTKDALGNNLTTGGHAVAFSIAGGTSTGPVSATTDNGDGTYTATLTGQIVGTGTTINVTIDGNAVSSTLPVVTVVPGPVSLLTSIISAAADSVLSDGTVLLTLDTKDDFGNDLTAGGHAVVFTASGGTSTGLIGGTTDNGDGTYTASFTGLLAGTATTIGATIDGQSVAAALPTITVLPGLPVNIAINAGDGQLTLFGTAVAIAPSVIVTDINGNPVAGVNVSFTVTAGLGAVLPITPVATGPDGIASTISWVLGGILPNNQLMATAAGVGSVTFTATAVSSQAVTLEEVVTTTSVDSSFAFPPISGGTAQTYVMFSTSLVTTDIDSVIGGGLNWSEQIEQCAGTQDHWSRIWTAQGSPAGPFQATVWTDVTAGAKKVSAVLSRYSNVSVIEGVTGNSNNGGSPCTGASPMTTTASLSLNSTVNNSVHLLAVGIKTDSLTAVTSGYSEVGRQIGSGDNLKVFVYSKEFATATTDNFSATISVPRRWSTSGLVLRPN